ncbi:tyrosine phosphatase family protein [Phlyctema vagabunda]|uniref:diphosphoinositol-polyphosphate diphosphatase n=1 Tax=Phlyctema vagabunda TaxID=108571 RepID=A0ABR4PX26_9HELO
MAEAALQAAKILRRSTRTFAEEINMDLEKHFVSRPSSYCEDKDMQHEFERNQRISRASSIDRGDISVPSYQPVTMIQHVNLGRDMHSMFPRTFEEMGKQMMRILENSRTAGNEDSGRPLNFGNVIPGIYRSSFPQAKDYEYLRALRLKTIVTLVKKDYPQGFCEFMQANGIRHIVIDMKGTKKQNIPEETMQSILRVVLDKANHPLLMHCNHGKHRTGCVTAVIRHISGWDVENIISEYENIAEPKIRDVDVAYIREYQISTLEGLFTQTKRRVVLLTTKMVRMMLLAVSILFLFWTTHSITPVHL